MQLLGSLLDYGLENVLTVRGTKDFKMTPMSILTKWLAAGQRAHNNVFHPHRQCDLPLLPDSAT